MLKLGFFFEDLKADDNDDDDDDVMLAYYTIGRYLSEGSPCSGKMLSIIIIALFWQYNSVDAVPVEIEYPSFLQDRHDKLMRSSHNRQICPVQRFIAAAQV